MLLILENNSNAVQHHCVKVINVLQVYGNLSKNV